MIRHHPYRVIKWVISQQTKILLDLPMGRKKSSITLNRELLDTYPDRTPT